MLAQQANADRRLSRLPARGDAHAAATNHDHAKAG
jgi:hypothetical protein